ncbi:MAG: glycoside hydrolase family 99-like domain-containing protein [Caldimonas sp.]
MNPKLLAFLLPQFHRIPENDEWWGEGFTEWTNVRKARPQFPGHRQPRVPLDGKYYDLLDPEVQDWQADLARQHGLHGFCYYHYWFAGRQLLEKPLQMILERRQPDFPFCVAWANEPWTRTWDGGEHNVLMPQSYGDKDDWTRHFRYLEKSFADPRYIQVDGRPMILIYRTASIPDCEAMIECWRNLASRSGFKGLHVVSMLTFYARDERKGIFDAFAEFEPVYTQTRLPPHLRARERAFNVTSRVAWKLFGKSLFPPRSLDYEAIWREIAARPISSGHYPGAFVDWDNSPRKSLNISLVMRNVKLDAFKREFGRLYQKARKAGSEFVFINAWNEWAEGTYLEPDEELGTAYLEAIRAAVRDPAPV